MFCEVVSGKSEEELPPPPQFIINNKDNAL
jgi:hypothetical protein